MKEELLTIDIGNTSISFGLFRRKQLIKTFSIDANQSEIRFKKEIRKKISNKEKQRILSVVVCSVAPSDLKVVVCWVKKELKMTPLIIGKDLKVPIESRYTSQQIGQDRLVCAYAAQKLYGCPLIVIDLGTAITCDFISVAGEYLGGVIIPGIEISAEALYQRTALLPKIKIELPKMLIGQNTRESILSGLFYGYGALLDGLVRRYHEMFKKRPRVILTGGYAPFLKKFMKVNIYKTDKILVLQGIRLLYWNVKNSN